MSISSRVSRLATLMAAPRPRRILRILGVGAVILYFVLGLVVVVLQQVVLPRVENYRADVEQGLSQALSRPVTIRAIDARWRLLWPSLRIHGLEVRDEEGRPALAFDEVEADVAWSSLWHWTPHFARLEINAPRLDLRRDTAGRLFVAGLEIKPEQTSGAGFSEWVLAQHRIVIRNATLTWHDELRRAPPLALSNVNLDLRNRGSRHRFGLTADPPAALAARLDIRGDFRGRDLAAIETWKGRAYAELDYADLSGWRPWVDYPVDLQYGYGGVRVWLDLDRQTLAGVTADVRLGRTIGRLAPELPMMDLEYLEGRLAIQRRADGFAFDCRHLSLETRTGIHVEPTDMSVRQFSADGRRPAQGEVNANQLDLGALAAIAAYLPMDTMVRQKLAALAPRGVVHELQLAWTGEPDALATYRGKARFENLGLNASGLVPGFSGLDGTIEGNEKGGALKLATQAAVLDLPAVFERSAMKLATLDANVDWTIRNGVVDVRLPRARFQNDDAAGEASGSYRSNGAGPGEIDLSAKLSRADGGSVWRYMPLVVDNGVRNWLHESISGGAATATLRLKGDLNRFPFGDGSGTFEVKSSFQGATLRYAPDWPALENVSGELLFAGPRMLIQARQAKLWGLQLADVDAEISDLGESGQPLVITGTASGPTADFLRFIESSPVGGYIGHVTQNMKAGGSGGLKLRLELPLDDLPATRVDGRYRFIANQLVIDNDLPPVSAINGELHFTESGLDAKRIRGTMLDAPAVVDIATENGRIAIQANGSASVAALRQIYGHPVLEHMTGSTPWHGVISVRKRIAEMHFESSLLGISSSLPAPFNKSALDSMPLVFDSKPLPEAAPSTRSQMEVSLGGTLQARFVRRSTDAGSVVEQGLIAIGASGAKLPERGTLLALAAPRVDVDFWRKLLVAAESGGAGVQLVDQVQMETPELTGFGRSLHDVRLAGGHADRTWKMDLKSREAAGQISWTDGDRENRLSARLARLDFPDGSESRNAFSDPDSNDPMPAIDVAVERLLFHGRELGSLRLLAENEAGLWNVGFNVHNEDGELHGTGHWQAAQMSMGLDFSMNALSIEGMLGRLGYPEAIRRGRATLSGQLAWHGRPTAIDYPSLGGILLLEAERGQFKKLEPGVGRLLGVLSLQSLPRRISLDFRDIFSEGFAFENIDGKVSVDRGIMETHEFKIAGPAATVLMDGTVNLIGETQDLKVRVQPAIGETVATGVLLVNPLIGAAAWVMNRVFGNPLDKAFAFDYTVTGAWTDPKVEKVAVQPPGAAKQSGEQVIP